MPESQNFHGGMNVSGSIQNFGGTNTNTQNNYYAPTPRDELATHLATLRAEHPRPEQAEVEVRSIENEIEHPTPDGPARIDRALKRLASSAGSARTITEAVAAIGALVAAHWPF